MDPDRYTLRGSFFMPDLPIKGIGRIVAGASGWAMRGQEFACAKPGCDAWAEDFARAPRVLYRRAGGELTLGLRIGPFARDGSARFAPFCVLRFHAINRSSGPALVGAWR